MTANTLKPSFCFLLIGSGRLARHLHHYFNLLNIPHQTWDRAQDPLAIKSKILSSTHVFLAISDSAILGFYRQNLAGLEKIVVHFSGAHHFDGMISAHPLMSFGPELYDLEFYKKVHFCMTGGSLAEALPMLTNSSSELSIEQKALYHASCVIGGNFTTLLIRQMLLNFKELSVPAEAAHLYLNRVIQNTFANPEQALTGPLVRKDAETIKINLEALEAHPRQKAALEIYKTFLNNYWPEYPRK